MVAYITTSFDNEVSRLLRQGGVGCMPSDTIYGLSAAAMDHGAVSRLHSIKDRSSHKPFIVLFSDYKMLNLLSISEKQAEPVKKYWPGGLTLICPAVGAPDWLHLGLKSLAVRMPDNPQLLNLIETTGPLISTSANPEGQKPAESIAEAKNYFGRRLDFYVDGGSLAGREPSTIVKFKNGKLEVIRQGSTVISKRDLA